MESVLAWWYHPKMNKYATKTCGKCGIKKPSNQLYTKSVDKKYTGSSSRSVNVLTFIGGLLGNKGARSAINQWLWQSSNRKYSGGTSKEINLCLRCYHFVPGSNSVKGIYKFLLFPFYLPYSFVRLVVTSPVTRVLFIHIARGLMWILFKFMRFLRFLGIKSFDQDGDGSIDGNDFQIAYKKVVKVFSKAEKE